MGKRKRLEAMIDRHHRTVYRHAVWLVGDPEAAADLVQEAFYQAWKSLQRCATPRHELAWLLAILRRQAARAYSARAREPVARATEMQMALAGPEGDLDRILDLIAALQTLPLGQRDLLLLYALHGFSYQEIARQLDIPLGTVMSRLARARRDLHRRMDVDETAAANVVPFPRRGRSRTGG